MIQYLCNFFYSSFYEHRTQNNDNLRHLTAAARSGLMYRYELETGASAVVNKEPTQEYIDYENAFFANIGPRGLNTEQVAELITDGAKRATQILADLRI